LKVKRRLTSFVKFAYNDNLDKRIEPELNAAQPSVLRTDLPRVVTTVNEAAVALGGPLRRRNAGSPTKRAAGLQEEAQSVRWTGELR
jgi:hypothetical protein